MSELQPLSRASQIWSPADMSAQGTGLRGATAARQGPSGKQVTTETDEVLLERIGRGDKAAASSLVMRKLPRLLSLGRRLLNDAAEAEDVAQETLVRTWKQARDWVPGKARIDTWMHRVALNLCYDRLRRRRITVSPDDVEIIDEADGPVVQLEQAQMAQRMQAAIASLPERQRTAITLSYYQELSNIDAAAVMEVSIEALESLLARARRSLRSLMRDDNPKPVTDTAKETSLRGGK